MAQYLEAKTSTLPGSFPVISNTALMNLYVYDFKVIYMEQVHAHQ